MKLLIGADIVPTKSNWNMFAGEDVKTLLSVSLMLNR